MGRSRRVTSGGMAALIALAIGASGTTTVFAAGWASLSTPNPDMPNGSLSSVSCTGTKACTAVGRQVNPSGVEVGLAQQWNGKTWSAQSVAVPNSGLAVALLGVTCVAATDCVAVGAWVNNGPFQVPLAEHWNGAAWAVVQTPTPSGGISNVLDAVSCPSATLCIAVGSDSGYSGTQVSLAEMWNGSSWSLQPTPNPGGATSSTLNGISCASATDCEAVGSSNATQTLAEHWDGSTWSIQPTPNPSGASGTSLAAVSCASTTACVAVGGTCMPPAGCNQSGGPPTTPFSEQWNGTSWSPLSAPAPNGASSSYLDSLFCPSATACEAVGYNKTTTGSELTLAEHWNGSKWSLQTSPNPKGATFSSLAGIACTSASSCVSVGTADQRTIAEAWNGTAWVLVSSTNPHGTLGASLAGVACASSIACTAVGTFNLSSGGESAFAERWNGTAWSVEPAARPSGATFALLLGASCSSASACTAVGGYGKSTSTFPSLAERWNGTAWSIQPTPNPTGTGYARLDAVSCPTSTACFAVGGFESSKSHCGGTDSPLAERWSGTAWTLPSMPTPSGAVCVSVSGVSCRTSSQCIAVGSYLDNSLTTFTLAEKWNGSSWSITTSPSPGNKVSQLNAVSCPAASLCVAVGYVDSTGSLAEAWNGTSWSVQGISDCCALNGVSCATATACIAVGGTITEQWNGSAWSFVQPAPPNNSFYSFLAAVSCASATTCAAVGGASDVGILSSGAPLVTQAQSFSG